MSRSFWSTLLGIATLFTPGVSHAAPVHIGVSPIISEQSALPREQLNIPIVVYNTTNAVQPLQTSVTEANPQGVQGGLSFGNSIAAAQWVAIEPDQAILEPNSHSTFVAHVTVPQNALAGDRAFAILFSPFSQSQGEQINIQTQIASLLFLRVQGELREQGSAALSSPPWWMPSTPFTLSFQNTGTVREQFSGALVITDWHGHQISSHSLAEYGSLTTLPNSVRELPFDARVGNGIFRITAQLRSVSGKSYTAQTWVVHGLWAGSIESILILLFLFTVLYIAVTGWRLRMLFKKILQ